MLSRDYIGLALSTSSKNFLSVFLYICIFVDSADFFSLSMTTGPRAASTAAAAGVTALMVGIDGAGGVLAGISASSADDGIIARGVAGGVSVDGVVGGNNAGDVEGDIDGGRNPGDVEGEVDGGQSTDAFARPWRVA